MDNFEKIINKDSFLKNIKRLFIVKQMEQLNIRQVLINFDDITKTFKFELKKDDTNVYIQEYKVKRGKKRENDNNIKYKKVKIDNNQNETNNIEYDNSSKHDFDPKISPPSCHIITE